MRGSKTHQFSMVDGAPRYVGSVSAAPSLECGFAAAAAPSVHFGAAPVEDLTRAAPEVFKAM